MPDKISSGGAHLSLKSEDIQMVEHISSLYPFASLLFNFPMCCFVQLEYFISPTKRLIQLDFIL